MNMKPQVVLKHLAAAEGYLQLSLPRYAIGELKRIDNPGVFQPIAELFLGEALHAQERFDEAAATLERAAPQLPPVLESRAWRALSSCYHELGRSEAAARAAETAKSMPGGILTIIVQVAPADQGRLSFGGGPVSGNDQGPADISPHSLN
jgi:tetratricopeptide (TPR) repeat protein